MKAPAWRIGVPWARPLAKMPVFAECSARQLRRIARWGDVIEVQSGQSLAREGHSDWWFFVVVSGRVALSHSGIAAGEVLPGGHFGDAAIIGLRPQPLTATADEPSVLFVLGPRYVLSLLSSSSAFQRAVAPDVQPRQYAEFARRMHADGEAEWRALAHAQRQVVAVQGARAEAARNEAARTPQRDRLPGRALSLAEAVAALAQLPPAPQVTTAEPSAVRRYWWAAPVTLAVAALAAVLLLYHPPRLVLSAGRPIDVTADIQVSGEQTFTPSGHYLMLWVSAKQPDLGGYLIARLTGRTTVPLDAVDASAQRAAGREQYLSSQSVAIRLAEKAAGVDPRHVTVHIRDRGLAGPSAGLAYALALEDLLTPGDLTRGRRIGVTGELAPDGRVDAIGELPIKARGAAHDHASLLVVPASQVAGLAGIMPACGVTSLSDALRLLALTTLRCRSSPT